MLTVNGPEVEPAVTVTVAGIVSPGTPVLLTVTTTPLAPAAFDNVTVQLLLAFAPNVVGLHCSDETPAAAVVARLMVTLWDDPLYNARTNPLWSTLTVPVLITNDPVVAFAATVTDDGIVKLFGELGKAEVLLNEPLVTVTAAPPSGAGADKVIVQLLLAFDPKVVGLHCSDEMTTVESVRVTGALCEEPL